MIIQSLIFVGNSLYKYILPISFASLIYFDWNSCNANEVRMLICCAIILFIRVENSFAPYRQEYQQLSFYREKVEFEYEVTIILGLVKMINSFSFETGQESQTYIKICQCVFNIYLILNLSCYVLAFLMVICFSLFVLIGFIRGNQQFINIRQGLSVDELQQLERKLWSEWKPSLAEEMENVVPDERFETYSHLRRQLSREEEVCSICLNDFKLQEQVAQVPKCNHFFHSECIDEWLQVNPNCPFCRNNVRLALM